MASRVARIAGAASLPVTRTVLAIRSSSPSGRSAAGGPGPACAVSSRLVRTSPAHPLVRRSLQRRAGSGPPHHRFLDLPGQLEVPLRDAVRGVVGELDPHLPPGHLEVGVVPGGLGEVADRVHQRQGREPAVRVVLAADPPPLVPPARQLLLKPLFDHVIGQNRKLLLLLRFLRHDAPHISCSPIQAASPHDDAAPHDDGLARDAFGGGLGGPLRGLPLEIDCAGEARARTGASSLHPSLLRYGPRSPARRRQPMTTPPPTMTVSPVMNDACGEARKSTADATSSGVPQRARGVAPTTARLVASSTSSPHLVLIQPGATTLTRTRGANSRARDRLSARMPPLAAA